MTQKKYVPIRETVRIAAIQYGLRQIHEWSGFEEQMRFLVNSAGEYKPQFIMLPEIFTAQLRRSWTPPTCAARCVA